MDMKEVIEFIARNLVDHPDEVSLEEVDKENSIMIRLRVNPEDIGKVVGRNGRTAQSMRTLLSAMGARTGKRAMLEILGSVPR
jgi:predicted RNA-binding protein YlqC (UPF0109 family)